MGLLPLFLAVLTLALWPRERFNLYLALLGLLALLLSFGRHFPFLYDLMFNFFPYFNKFRVPSMMTLLLQFPVAILAAIGLDRLLKGMPGVDPARVRRVVAVVGGLFLAVVLGLGLYGASGSFASEVSGRIGERVQQQGATAAQIQTYASQLTPKVLAKVHGDFIRGLVILALGLGLVWLLQRRKIPAWMAGAGIILLTVIDLWGVAARPAVYHDRKEDSHAFDVTETVRFLQNEREPYRVLPLTGQGLNNNWYAYFKIPSVLGYHPAKIKIYQDLIDDRGPVGVRRSVIRGHLLDILNAKYVITDSGRTGPAVLQAAPGRYEVAHRSAREMVLRNKSALPRLWFVDRTRVVADEKQHLAAVADPAWNPREEALLFEDPGPIDPGTGGSATIESYAPREIHAAVTSPGNSLLMMSEVYYEPGWKATLDGEPAAIRRADYALRAIRVPKGSHELVLRFDPDSFRIGAALSVAAYLAILIAFGASFLPALRTRRG